MSEIVFARVRRFHLLVAALAPSLAVMVAACSGIRIPTAEDLLPQTPKFELKTLPSSPVRRLGPPGLIGPDGSCSAPTGQSEFSGSGIALQMSECDVVQRAGAPENIDISTNPAGERTAVLTYRGERAGIYRFVSGRLVSIERGAEPPAPERPAKKKSPKKSAGATSTKLR